MLIRIDLSELRKIRRSEILLRFLLGGVVTVSTGLIARHFGPAVGGLFLALPVIFPATATLVERNEREKEWHAGIKDTSRARLSAAIDARGATLGGVALIAFALFIWKGLPTTPAPLALTVALMAWFALATLLWLLRRWHTRWRVRTP